MCTLTYIPVNSLDFVFTTNRDESPLRKTIAPKVYEINGNRAIYPKDEEASGTWMLCYESGLTICLLNGAFVKHCHIPPYKKSRGIVVLEFTDYPSTIDFVCRYNFTGIEPFTLLIVRYSKQRKIEEVRWDGGAIHFRCLDACSPHIWSSATLYDQEVREKRRIWFKNWLMKNQISQDSILSFHKDSGKEDSANALVMNRNDVVKTLSITQVSKMGVQVGMYYEELVANYRKEVFFEKEKSL